jgi:hypothetical protein
MNTKQCYAVGYKQGKDIGVYEYDQYQYWSDQEQYAYMQGYEAGVADYCREMEVTE